MFVNRIILRCSISKERCRFRATSLLYHRFWLLQVAAVIFFMNCPVLSVGLVFQAIGGTVSYFSLSFLFCKSARRFFSAECLGWEIGVKISEELSVIWRTKT